MTLLANLFFALGSIFLLAGTIINILEELGR